MPDEYQTAKLLKTGEHIIVKSVLPETNIARLSNIANRLENTESRPIYVAREPLLGDNASDRYLSAGIDIILKRASTWLKATLGEKWLILANKSLLRRTWPLSEREARELGHNASNLTWHQDSNYKHGIKPMVVMMVPLQNGAGSRRPGLSILEMPTNQFEGVFGYEGNRVDEFERKVIKKYGQFKTSNPVLDSGDLLIFNGLTFHRTFSKDTMNSHRDALLIRAIKPEDAENFPNGPHWIIKTR